MFINKSTRVLALLLVTALATACSQNTAVDKANAVHDHADHKNDTYAEHQHHENHANHETQANHQAAHVAEYMAAMNEMHVAMNDGMNAKNTNANTVFIKGMIPHHQAALAMAYTQLRYGQDSHLKDLAQIIIDTQQAEISWMKEWLHKNAEQQPSADISAMQAEYAEKDAANHQAMMAGISDPDPDAAFIKGMIPHHQGAIDMSKLALAHGADGEIAKLAKDIMNAQAAEISQMQAWLKQHQTKH